MNKGTLFTKGIFIENPLLITAMGISPALIGAKSAELAVALGLSAIAILIPSTLIMSLLKKFISDKTETLTILVLTAGFTAIVSILMRGYEPVLYEELMIPLAFISISCVLIETLTFYPRNYKMSETILNSMGIGIGYLIGLFLVGAIRELLATGSFWGTKVIPTITLEGDNFFITISGGLFVLGIVMAFFHWIANKIKRRSKGIWQ